MTSTSYRGFRFRWNRNTGGLTIGVISLLNINMQHRSADLALAIFEGEYWNKGYGTDAVVIVLRFAFDSLNLHRVQLTVHEDNLRARRCYEKCGFVEEGFMRDHYYRPGRYTNSVRLSLLEHEFRAKHPRQNAPVAGRAG